VQRRSVQNLLLIIAVLILTIGVIATLFWGR
jgi:hypothetical protein